MDEFEAAYRKYFDDVFRYLRGLTAAEKFRRPVPHPMRI